MVVERRRRPLRASMVVSLWWCPLRGKPPTRHTVVASLSGLWSRPWWCPCPRAGQTAYAAQLCGKPPFGGVPVGGVHYVADRLRGTTSWQTACAAQLRGAVPALTGSAPCPFWSTLRVDRVNPLRGCLPLGYYSEGGAHLRGKPPSVGYHYPRWGLLSRHNPEGVHCVAYPLRGAVLLRRGAQLRSTVAQLRGAVIRYPRRGRPLRGNTLYATQVKSMTKGGTFVVAK